METDTCVTVVQSTAPGTLQNLISPLCWAWLAGSGWENMQGYLNKLQRGTTSNIDNI